MFFLNCALTDITACSDQYLYTKCTFSYIGGKRCDAVVSAHIQPPLCTEHAYMLIEGSSSSRYPLPKAVKSTVEPQKSAVKEEPSNVEAVKDISSTQEDSNKTTPQETLKEPQVVEELANVISPVSTDSNTCGSKSQDRLYALMCSESEAESTDKEKEL